MAIVPPATIGILGGGQLGRMIALAARSMGYGVQVLDPSAECAARAVADRVIAAPFDDAGAAAELANSSDVVTLEIEQIAPAALAAVERIRPLRPGAHVLAMVQDRQKQKAWLALQGIPIGPYALVESAEALSRAREIHGAPLFVKACEGGYDGRSQVKVEASTNTAEAFASIGSRRSVAEQALDLALELSVLVARRPSGDMLAYAPAVNHHEAQVLAWSTLPGELDPEIIAQARQLALHIADALSLEGILAVEMFLLCDGRLLVNELAPRPHNSYHASELACPTSQFEQIIRAVCDLPLGAVEPTRPSAIYNLFGDLWLRDSPPDFAHALGIPGVRLFLYGKGGARAARKMGHLAASGLTAHDALATVQRAAALL